MQFLAKCNINIKKCRKRLSLHYISYAINHLTKEKTFYKNSLDHQYFHFTNETIFEINFLNILMADILFKQTSFMSFCNAYNFLYAPKSTTRYFLNSKRLADVFFCYNIQRYYSEFKKNDTLKSNTISNLFVLYYYLVIFIFLVEFFSNYQTNPIDKVLRDLKPELFSQFVRKWSSHTHQAENCNYTITFDGLWKISRLKCSYDNVVFPSNEFGDLPYGCVQTPLRNNYYCSNHQNYNLVFNNGDKFLSLQPKQIKATRLSKIFYNYLYLYALLI
jgi:hypothetical protein